MGLLTLPMEKEDIPILISLRNRELLKRICRKKLKRANWLKFEI